MNKRLRAGINQSMLRAYVFIYLVLVFAKKIKEGVFKYHINLFYFKSKYLRW